MSTTIITRAEMVKTFKACQQIEGEIWNQLQKRAISDVTPSQAVYHALKQLQRPAWIAEDAWGYEIGSVSAWALAHGSLSVWKAAGAMKAPELHRFLHQRRKTSERLEEARYLFEDMSLIGDEELL